MNLLGESSKLTWLDDRTQGVSKQIYVGYLELEMVS